MCNVRIGFLFMEKYSGIKTVNASLVLDYEYIQMLRDADRKIPNPNKIIAQGGGQENMLSTPADITICGGCRGGSKTFTLLMETLKDIKNKISKRFDFCNYDFILKLNDEQLNLNAINACFFFILFYFSKN